MKKLTVLIPCFNEEHGIVAVINNLPKSKLAQHGIKLDVLVIDNNSSDQTAEVARTAGARVVVARKQGKGNALRKGFYSISPDTDYVVMLDGDDTYKSQEIMRLIEPIESGFAKVIIGSRMHGRIKAGSMKPLNLAGNMVFSNLVRTAYKVSVTDVLTGYFAWSFEVIKKLRPHLQSDGFSIEMEMITKMARLGYEIYSVPISYDPRKGESSLKPVRDGARIMGVFMNNLSWEPKSTSKLPVTSAQSRTKYFKSFTTTEKALAGKKK